MKKCFLLVLMVLGAQLVCAADTWSDLLRAYKMDLSTLVRGNGYQIFRSEAGGIGIAYSEIDSAGQCHFSLAMVPLVANGLRWLPGAGANFLEIRADGRILNLGYYGNQLIFLVQRDSGVFWVGEDGKRVEIPAADPPSPVSAPTLRIEDTRAVDIGLSVFWADRNVGADAPEAYGDYVPFGTKVPWGGIWRTPSCKELEELVQKCSWELTACNGVDGYEVTGPNGNCIFLPLGGLLGDDGTLDRPGTIGAILSSERPPGQYYIDVGDFFYLQMTCSTSEEYRHYVRYMVIAGEKMSLRPVLPKP